MATRRWMLNRGETDVSVTEAVGDATASKNIELTVDLAPGMAKNEVLVALRTFERYILKGNWPPA